MASQNILFLDVDGVLNSSYHQTDEQIEMSKVELLRQIVKETNPFIVLSSTWRLSERNFKLINHTLGILGIKISGVTPDLSRSRKEEIAEWLTLNPSFTNVAILDDDPDACLIGDNIRFFQTNYKIGLTKEIKDEIIRFYLRCSR